MKTRLFVVLLMIYFLDSLLVPQSTKQVYADTYRKKIIIDCARVIHQDKKDFPLLVSLSDNNLKSKSEGGHVSQKTGEDIFFTLPDGKTVLPYEVQSYSSDTGTVKAYVKIPVLSSSRNTEIFIYYGDAEKKKSDEVWDENYSLALHLNKTTDPDRDIRGTENLKLSDQITVQAWVCWDKYQPELIQPLVSKWALNSSFTTFDAFDANTTDSLDTRGFFGAVFDGRYIYFSPIRLSSDYSGAHGTVLRYDTHKDFQNTESYDAYDASATNGLYAKGFCGTAFDGRYIYLVPRHDGKEYHSRFIRYDTHMDFKDSASWDSYDAGIASSHQGAAFDGRYLYFPAAHRWENEKHSYDGKSIRFDTHSDFKDPSSWRVFDTNSASELESLCFDGANFDGRHVYFSPIYTQVAVRYDTKGDYGDKKSWEVFDAKPFGMGVLVGTIFDGRYIYPVHYDSSNSIRYDTHGKFTDSSSWENYDHGKVNGLDTNGFAGGFFDGKYVYFQPFVRGPNEGEEGWQAHSNFLRYDTQGTFDSQDSWSAQNAGNTSGMNTTGYNSGVFDGRYYYSAPFRNQKGCIGKILRYDTVGENGSFILNYCTNGSNGGLSATVSGPSFIINTVRGPISVLAKEALLPGWHHLSGVYTGNKIKLFIDGMLVGERAGTGAIQANSVPVAIGRLHESSARFSGIVDEVRISNISRDDSWIKTEYKNLINPAEFIQTGKEEKMK